MALWAWLDLKPLDIAAFVISSIIGGVAGFIFLPNVSLFGLVSGLVSYHLFLAWLVFDQEREGMLTLSIVSTVLYHLAFMAVIYATHRAIGAINASHSLYLIPGKNGVSYALGLLIPAIALFERGWLFSGKGRKINQPTVVAADSAVYSATTDDYIEWQRLLASGQRPPAKRGMTLKDEYEQWAAARAQARAAGASTNQPT
jgi:hypothetical protein